MVTIRETTLCPWVLPLRAALATAYGAVAQRSGYAIRLRAHDGTTGTGEALPHPAAPPETTVGLYEALRAGAVALRAAAPAPLATLVEMLRDLPPPVASGLDMALHDLAARSAGCSVAMLLGPVRRRSILTSTLLEGRTPAELAAAARRAQAAGFRDAKIKVGADLDEAVGRVSSVRRAAPGLALRVDANGAWTGTRAGAAARRLRPFDLAWLEQPAPPGDLDGLVAARAGGIRIAADESVTGPAAVHALAAARAVDVIVLKLVQLGGLAAALATARAATACGLAVTVTTALESSLGTAAAIHLAAVLPDPLLPCGLATTQLLAVDPVNPSIPALPQLALPCGPGLGVQLAPAAMSCGDPW